MAEAATPRRIGHYLITEKLGEGGMGVVYAARDERLGRAVAVKMIHAGSGDTRARERLWREARSAASVNHPNICQIHEIGEESSEPYIVMELLEGESLASRLRRGPLPLAEAAPVALAVLTALEALHRRGIMHRDLKPSNVFLTPHGVKLLDFGLARPAAGAALAAGGAPDLDLTLPGALVGTPRYMSPEQLRGEEIDPRADLFAAGALLFEMLAGRPAFAGGSPVEIYHAVLHEQPPALSGSAAIAGANRIVFRGLAKRREERYPAAAAMAEDLRALLLSPEAEARVSAHPVSRLIVLPFRLLRPDPEIDFLSFSLAEAITVSLSALESLVVRSSLTAARFAADPAPDLKRIAAEADVDAVLAGSLLRAGDEIRVTAQLVEPRAGTVLWSHGTQVPMREMFALEDALTRRVVASLAPALSEREERLLGRDVPASPTAYEFYLRGTQQAHGPSHWRVARDLFRRSVEEDPSYAPAWARLARCHWLLGKYMGEFEAERARAEAALRRALELNPDLPMAHSLYANLELHSGRSLEAMRRLLARARRQRHEPEIFSGLVAALRFCGLLEASLAAHAEARRLDPGIVTSVRYTCAMVGDYERALQEARTDLPLAECWFLAFMGREDEALARLASLDREYWEAEDTQLRNEHVALEALLEGRREESAAAFTRLAGSPDPEETYYAGLGLARLGEAEHALAALRSAVERGFVCFPGFVREPWLDPLRATPDCRDLLLEAETRHRTAVAAFLEDGGDRLLGLGARA